MLKKFKVSLSYMLVLTVFLTMSIFTSFFSVVQAASGEDGNEFQVETKFMPATLVPNQMMTASVTATNISTVEYSGKKDVLVIVGLYDNKNTMVNVSYISKGISFKGTEVLSAGFKLPSNVSGYSVRAFMWDGYDLKTTNMNPMSNVVEISNGDTPVTPTTTQPTTTPTTTPPTTNPPAADFSLIGFAAMDGGTTGGTDGKVVTTSSLTEINNLISAKRKANDTSPLIIKINGKITGSEAIPVKDVSNITFLGVGTSGELQGVGINIVRSSNIIVQNLKIHHTLAPMDGIGIENSNHVWVDHCEIYNMIGDCNGDGKIDTKGDISGGDVDWYDGLLDAKGSSEYITVSWTYFHDAFKTSLVGSSDSDASDRKMTFHHNIYENCNSRLPSYRGGTGHIFNNYYVDVGSTGVNSRMGAKLRVEGNVFENVGSGAVDEKLGLEEGPIGAYYSDAPGYWDVKDNTFVSCKGNQPTTSNCTFNPPYDYSKVLNSASQVKALVRKYAGIGKLDGNTPVIIPTPSPTSVVPGRTPTPTPTSTPAKTLVPTPTATYIPPVSGNTVTVRDFDSLKNAAANAANGQTIEIASNLLDCTSQLLLDKVNSNITIKAASGYTPVLDFKSWREAAQKLSSSKTGDPYVGIRITGSKYTLKGLIIQKAYDNGILIKPTMDANAKITVAPVSPDGNTIDSCVMRYNGDAGLQIAGSQTLEEAGFSVRPNNTTVINCVAYRNFDILTSGGNADGFAAKLYLGKGTKFINCASIENSDDAWDSFGVDDSDITYTNCIAYHSGDSAIFDGTYDKAKGLPVDLDMTVGKCSGNGNGFKMGSGDSKYGPQTNGIRTLSNCVAVDNVAKGVDENNGAGTINCTNTWAFGNGKGDFVIDLMKAGTFTGNQAGAVKNLKNPSGGTVTVNTNVPRAEFEAAIAKIRQQLRDNKIPDLVSFSWWK